MMKKEQMTDFELVLVLEHNSISRLTIKCHRYVLVTKSNYFYKKIYSNKDEIVGNKIIFNANYNVLQFKTIIEYLYLDDSAFLNNIESSNNSSYLDALIDYLKLAKLFELKVLQTLIENKIKVTLSKYYPTNPPMGIGLLKFILNIKVYLFNTNFYLF